MIRHAVLGLLLALSAAAQVLAGPLLSFRDPVAKIVGGSLAVSGQFPWQLLLKRDESAQCGAVLISANRAITAAHCLHDGSTYTVVAGEQNRQTTSGKEVTLTVSSWTRHPNYSMGSGYPNDIGILRFSENFPINSYIETISMAPSTSTDFTGTTCTISGWGLTIGNGTPSIDLRYAKMRVLSNSECASIWSPSPGATINEGHICVFESGISSCSVDSGGPMVCNGVVAGITSWGDGYCSGNYPSVYARVSYFRDWIDSNL